MNAGFQTIRVAMKVTSNAPAERLRELALLAQRRSPVFNSVSRPVPVAVTIEKGPGTGGSALAAAPLRRDIAP